MSKANFKDHTEIRSYCLRNLYCFCGIDCCKEIKQIFSEIWIISAVQYKGFYYVPFNISGFARCGENFMLALEHREFIYEFNFEIKEPF